MLIAHESVYEMVLTDPSYLCNFPSEVIIVGASIKEQQLNTIRPSECILVSAKGFSDGHTPVDNIREMYSLLDFFQSVSFPSLSAFEETV